MKEEEPKWETKVKAIPGDCSLPGLGMNEEDRRRVVERVSVVFHSAATVRFDEHLRTALGINVLGTKHILTLAKEMTQLKVSQPSYIFIISPYQFT
jgi:fatty acyl-CoA reductase